MKYTFKELIDVPKLQELADELYTATSIPSAIVAMDGEILTGSGWQKICTDFHRKHPQIEKECIKSDTNIRTKLADGEPFAIYKCPRGLVDGSSPVIIAGEHVANVFSGQVFLEPPDETTEQFFREQARKFGFDETEYMKAFKEIPIFTEKKFRAGISFLAKLAQSISDTGLTRLRELEGMEALKKTQRLLTDTEKMGKVGGWEFNIHTEKTTWTEEIYNIHEVDLTYDPTVRKAVNFYTPDSRPIIEQAVQRAIEHGEPYDVELEIMTGKGNLRIVHAIGKADLEHNRVHGFFQDITKRKRAEEALLNQKYFLQKAQELGHIGTWELDIKKNELLWTDENYRIFGLSIGTKLTYEIFMDRVHPDDREYVDKEWKAAFDKQPYDIEHRLLVDGKVKWVKEKAKLQFNEKDECIRGTGVTQDITVRKHLEEQVKQKLIALTQPEVDVGGLSLHDILGVDILQRLQDAFAEAFNMPSIICGPDGKPFTTPSCFTSFCKLVRNTEKGATNCETFDGELMQVLRKNQTPHIRHGCVLKNIVTGTVPIVIQGQHLANWGFGQRVNRNLDLDEVRRYALTIGVDEKALIEAAGELKLVDDAAFERIVNFAKTLSDQIGLLALQNLQQGRAISEQMRVEKSLYEAKLFLDNISDLAYIADKEGNVIYANRAAEKLTGLALSEIIDQPFLPLFVEKDHDSLIDAYNKTLAGESLENILTFNTEITCDFTSLPFKDNHGNIIGTFGIARDISDRLRTEKALSKSDARLKKAQSVANLGNWEYDIPTGKVWGSEQSFRIYDIERTSPYLPLDRVEACISDAPKVHQALADLIQENKPYDIEFWIQQEASGQTVVIHSIAELVYENGMPVKVVGVIQDVTEQKREEKARKDLEAQLQQAQKMEAIGTLAGGIAHDFNNILGGIIGYAELAKMKAPEGSNVIAYLDKMIKSSDRAADLIKQILTLSRQHKQKQRPVQVRHIVKEALDLLRATLPTTIEIRKDVAKDTDVVNADPTQMHQVIMNLTTNAGHAMQENGGVLEVTLANVELDDLSASKHLDLTAGFYLRLTVSDTGHGMTPETMARIFDPYFTTKDTGEGTGLGLSVAHGIVKVHGGIITVYSELGKGTTFHVYLPVIHEAEKAEKDEPKEALPTGSERILFIDDEEVLLEIGGQMLELLGYEVVTKISSEQALEMFRKQPDQFDLVITDMTMPHLTGDKLAQELMTIRPNIPVILCTGHSRLVSEEKAEEIGIKAFVIKPLVMRNLAETVRKVLDEK